MKTFKQFQEAAFAPALVGGISKIPSTIGAVTTLFNMARRRKDGSKNDRKNLRPDLEAELRKRQKEREEKLPNLDDKLNTPTDQGGFVGGKVVDKKTRKRMNAPENQFNSYDPLKEEAPTNNVGGGQIAGTVEAGDDPPVKKGRKKKKGKKKRYIYGGTGSRRMWMKKNNK